MNEVLSNHRDSMVNHRNLPSFTKIGLIDLPSEVRSNSQPASVDPGWRRDARSCRVLAVGKWRRGLVRRGRYCTDCRVLRVGTVGRRVGAVVRHWKVEIEGTLHAKLVLYHL